MSWLVAGIATGASFLSNKGANKEEKRQADIEKFQETINLETMKGDVALQTLNMSQNLASLESEQVAMSSAMGKSTEGAGFQRMQEVGRDDLASNVTRMNDQVERAEKFGVLSASSIDKRTKASTKQRNIRTGTVGLMSYAKAFA